MTYDNLPELSREYAAGRLSRRGVLKLLGGMSAVAMGLGAGVSIGAVARAQSDSCDGNRRPLTGPTDCPDNRVPKLNYTPITNGCGPQSGRDLVPDDFGWWSFREPCNGHDRCYGTCGANKEDCDLKFLQDMQQECSKLPWYYAEKQVACVNAASVYWAAVRFTSKGKEAYETGQVEGCDCCEPTDSCVHCNCNGQIYRDVQLCLDECKATLGCFTGICAPVACP